MKLSRYQSQAAKIRSSVVAASEPRGAPGGATRLLTSLGEFGGFQL